MSRERRRARRVAILTYHSIDDSGSVLSTSPAEFAAHMRFLHETGARTFALDGAAGPDTPEKAVVITFDDGFENVYAHAFPVLSRYGFTATVFLVTDYCGRTNAWPTQPSGIVPQPLLHWRQVAEMSAAGVLLGAHSRTHPDLTRLAPRAVEEEVRGSKLAIEDITGRPVEAFAYPYGLYDGAVRRTVGRHFRLACSTMLGFATRRSDPLALERLDIYYLRHPRLFRTLFSTRGVAYLRLRRLLRAIRGRPVMRAAAPGP